MDNLDTIEEQKLGLVDLHPDIFGAFPRIEILWSNIRWQRMYRHIVSILLEIIKTVYASVEANCVLFL